MTKNWESYIPSIFIRPGWTFWDAEKKQRFTVVRAVDNGEMVGGKEINNVRSNKFWIRGKDLHESLVCFDVLLNPRHLRWKDETGADV